MALEDHTELHDDVVAPCCDVQLVVLFFVQANKAELQQLVSACKKCADALNPEGVCERRRFLPALLLAARHGHGHLQIVQYLLPWKIINYDYMRMYVGYRYYGRGEESFAYGG